MKYHMVIQGYLGLSDRLLVLDNLNTHTLGSLYDTFEPSEALRIAKRLEFHYTPKHGSWLNPVSEYRTLYVKTL